MQIPSLENVQVDNLPDECREPWDLMIRQWSQKLERNLLRTKYYDGRNELKNLSIAVPDSMAGISEVNSSLVDKLEKYFRISNI